MTERTTPLEEATKEIPQALYELDYKLFLFLSVMSVTASNYLYDRYLDYHSLPLSLASASLYLISTIADRTSTAKVINATNKASENGLSVNHSEKNPFIGKVRSEEEFKKNPKVLMIDIIATGFSATGIEVGIPLTVCKTVAALNNTRVAKRYNRAVEISENDIYSSSETL